MLRAVRRWLIRRLAGDQTLLVNATFYNNHIVTDNAEIINCTWTHTDFD